MLLLKKAEKAKYKLYINPLKVFVNKNSAKNFRQIFKILIENFCQNCKSKQEKNNKKKQTKHKKQQRNTKKQYKQQCKKQIKLK